MNFTSDHLQQFPRQPTTGLVLIRTHQAGIVARYLLRSKPSGVNYKCIEATVCGLIPINCKHINFVDDCPNEYWLKLIKRALTKISQ